MTVLHLFMGLDSFWKGRPLALEVIQLGHSIAMTKFRVARLTCFWSGACWSRVVIIIII